MKRFAFIDYRKPSLAEKNAALRKGIELIHVGFLKASTVTPADIGPNFDGVENVSTSVLSDSSDPGPWHLYMGTPIVIRTVTMFHVGRLVKAYPQELLLQDASWIPDTGKWTEFLKTGVITECQPFPDGFVVVGRGAVVDACRWNFPLPRMVL